MEDTICDRLLSNERIVLDLMYTFPKKNRTFALIHCNLTTGGMTTQTKIQSHLIARQISQFQSEFTHRILLDGNRSKSNNSAEQHFLLLKNQNMENDPDFYLNSAQTRFINGRLHSSFTLCSNTTPNNKIHFTFYANENRKPTRHDGSKNAFLRTYDVIPSTAIR